VPRRGHAIEASSGRYISNIFWQSFVGLRLMGQSVAMNNAIYGATVGDPLGDGELDGSDSGIEIIDGGRQMTLIGNAIAGSMGPCIGANGFHIPRERFQNQTGHGCLIGFGVKGDVSQDIQDLTLWQIRNVAIWGYSKSLAPVVSNCRIADSRVGFFWGAVGANAETHRIATQRTGVRKGTAQTIVVKSSLIASRSINNPRFGASVGILLPIFA